MGFFDGLFGDAKKSKIPGGKDRRKGDRRFDKNELKKKVYGDIRGLKKDRRKKS